MNPVERLKFLIEESEKLITDYTERCGNECNLIVAIIKMDIIRAKEACNEGDMAYIFHMIRLLGSHQ